MKKIAKQSMAALAVLAVAGPAFAQSSVKIAGRVDLGLQYVDNGAQRLKRVDSGTYTASRLSFSGAEDLGAGLSAGFYLESRFNADVGAQQSAAKFFNAGSQVYLESSDWGSITLGRQYSPIFWTFLGADDTGPLRLHGYSAVNLIQRSALARVSAAASPIKAAGSLDSLAGNLYQLGISSTFEDNMVAYKTPVFNGATARLAVSAPEGSPAGGGRVLGGNVEYRNGPFYGSMAYNQKRGTVPAGGGVHQTLTEAAVSGLYEVVPGTWKVWGNVHPWKLEDSAASLRGRDWMLGISYWFGASELWINYSAKTMDDCHACGSRGMAIGYHYRLSKRTELYASAARVANDANSANAMNSMAPATFGKTVTGYALGLATTF